MRNRNRKKDILIFAALLLIPAILLICGLVKNHIYNSATHTAAFSEKELFSAEDSTKESLSFRAVSRDSSWTKAFDINGEGVEEDNYQAYTIDYYVSNNTKDEVKSFSFRLNFHDDAFLLSAWNGSLEFHQHTAEGEVVDLVDDLRVFVPGDHKLLTYTDPVEGDTLVCMKPGDYLIYYPSSSQNAREMPIKPQEATVPGIIMYFPIGDPIDRIMSVELQYTFNRNLTREPLFWAAVVLTGIWFIVLINYIITSAQVRKYQERHKRDNEIINESMETFIGFIDAKDPYTNGHSIRVAQYTRLIAEELGYKGEELDRIYYVALLHDCGKIGVPDHILGKPGRLTDEEFEVIKSHTVRGGEIMSHFKSLENAGEGALYHHERYDGKGYPEGRKGEEIPFIARMICVADSFDAMNTNRVYRKKLTKEDILAELERCKGSQFDPKIADVMIELIKSDRLNVIEK
ncbi:MAG: HD-GYP domain-containing protein [Lachnospiraceae bacterium]|nr:HD-GYP domain-containing protein [Lachnospiraceae bacterium]